MSSMRSSSHWIGRRMSSLSSSHDGAGAVELAMAAADKGYEAERLLGSPGAVEEVMPVLREWLDPHHRRGADSREDYVMDALAVAYFLDCPRIRELAPSLMYWTDVIRYRMRALRLLGHLEGYSEGGFEGVE